MSLWAVFFSQSLDRIIIHIKGGQFWQGKIKSEGDLYGLKRFDEECKKQLVKIYNQGKHRAKRLS